MQWSPWAVVCGNSLASYPRLIIHQNSPSENSICRYRLEMLQGIPTEAQWSKTNKEIGRFSYVQPYSKAAC